MNISCEFPFVLSAEVPTNKKGPSVLGVTEGLTAAGDSDGGSEAKG